MGTSAKQAFGFLEAAFGNSQVSTFEKETELFVQEAIKVSVNDKLRKEAKKKNRG
jgi:hypothetical protein